MTEPRPCSHDFRAASDGETTSIYCVWCGALYRDGATAVDAGSESEFRPSRAELDRLVTYFREEDAAAGREGDHRNDSTVTTALRRLREGRAAEDSLKRLHRLAANLRREFPDPEHEPTRLA